MTLYNDIGKGYDTTRRADPEITRRLHQHLQIMDHSPVIDIACGTGNYTIALSDLGLNLTGVDLSTTMIAEAKQKSPAIPWDAANVMSLPYKNAQFHGAVCTLAIHHFPDLTNSFKEVNRILREGSRFVLFTSSPEQMQGYWLNEYFPEMMAESIRQMPSVQSIEAALLHSGFRLIGCESFLVEPDLQDFFLYSGKFIPEIYLRDEVRKGISSFASLAKQEEVEAGLRQLRADLDSGLFEERTARYVSRNGDYLYVVAEKTGSQGEVWSIGS